MTCKGDNAADPIVFRQHLKEIHNKAQITEKNLTKRDFHHIFYFFTKNLPISVFFNYIHKQAV